MILSKIEEMVCNLNTDKNGQMAKYNQFDVQFYAL